MKRDCPVCGSVGPRRVLHRQHFFDGPLGNGYDVVVCKKCGAGFADGIPSQPSLDRYYAKQSKYEYSQSGGEESPYDFKRFEAIADQVIPLLKSGSARVLDVGCATGGLLSVFKKRGFENLLGLDPSPACAKAARRLHGVEVRSTTLAQMPGWQERFDLVLVVGVLEHLRNVQPAMRTIANLLRDDGLLYCAQPDVTTFADCVNAPYQQFSVEHINFFSEQSLSRLIATSGLAPRRTWHWMIEWREGITDSVVSGIYSSLVTADLPEPKFPSRQSSTGNSEFAVAYDYQTESSLKRYLELCRKGDEKLIAVVDCLVASQEPILIWGAGTLTRRLLSSTRLPEANIVAFVDSDPGVQGRRLAGREILSPMQIGANVETIVVGSKAFKQEIIAIIRDQLTLTNKVIFLA